MKKGPTYDIYWFEENVLPRNIMSWALKKKRVPTNYVILIKDMYIDIVTSIRICNDESNVFLYFYLNDG
jgi:hypothetical protein